MLCIGPGSVCDVCLEPFGSDLKAPCSIDCGHVFCLECLNHISRAICPLCRTPFALGNHVKLHVDVDSTKRSPSPHHTSDAATLQEGRRLQEAIASVANQGSSEAGLCQLIKDCRTFLSGRPRQEFQDLRVSYRMVSYIYEIKSRLREKEHAVEPMQASIEALQGEKAELSERLARSETQRREDREAALAVEMSLRHHCEQTQASYTELVKLYHQAVARIDKIQSAPNPAHEEWEYRQQLKGFSYKSSPESSASSDSLSPPSQGFLISPLPEFTSTVLPSINAFSPLPEDDLSCDHGSKEVPVSLFHQAPAQSQQNLEQVFGPSPSPSPPSGPPTGLLSMTAPPRRMEDSRNNTRSQSFSAVDSRQSSRPPTCPSSPKPVTGTTPDQTSTVSTGVGIPVSRDPERLRTRLRDLLDPNSPGMSSSLPNLSPVAQSHVGRGEHRYTTPAQQQNSRRSSRSPPPRSESTASSLSHSVPSLGGTEAPSSLSSTTTTPSVVYSSVTATRQAPTLSHASAAAQALERVQKEERQSAVKEREKEQRTVSSQQSAPPVGVSVSQGRPASDRPPISRNNTQPYMIPPQGSSSTERLAQFRPQPASSPTKERSSSIVSREQQSHSKPTMGASNSSGNNNGNNTSGTSLSREPSRRNHQQSSIGSSKGKVISTTMLHSLTSYA